MIASRLGNESPSRWAEMYRYDPKVDVALLNAIDALAAYEQKAIGAYYDRAMKRSDNGSLDYLSEEQEEE
jgi:hypothetical protein